MISADDKAGNVNGQALPSYSCIPDLIITIFGVRTTALWSVTLWESKTGLAVISRVLFSVIVITVGFKIKARRAN